MLIKKNGSKNELVEFVNHHHLNNCKVVIFRIDDIINELNLILININKNNINISTLESILEHILELLKIYFKDNNIFTRDILITGITDSIIHYLFSYNNRVSRESINYDVIELFVSTIEDMLIDRIITNYLNLVNNKIVITEFALTLENDLVVFFNSY